MRNNLITRPLTGIPRRVSLLRDDFFFPMQETFDRFFEDFFGTDKIFNSVTSKNGYPKMEVGVEGDSWIVRVAVPGVKEEDLLIEVDDSDKGNRILSIQGQMSEEYQSPDKAEYFVRELRKSKFVRQLKLPEKLIGDPEAIMRDGILTLKWAKPLPEGEESPAIKRIEIKKE